MRVNIFFKSITFLLSFLMFMNVSGFLPAGDYFVKTSASGSNKEVNIGYKFNFGPQQGEPEGNNYIEKLKQEDTKGAGTAIGLIILGACIVAAAVLIVNKADDVIDEADDTTDDLTDLVEDKYKEIKEEVDSRT